MTSEILRGEDAIFGFELDRLPNEIDNDYMPNVVDFEISAKLKACHSEIVPSESVASILDAQIQIKDSKSGFVIFTANAMADLKEGLFGFDILFSHKTNSNFTFRTNPIFFKIIRGFK